MTGRGGSLTNRREVALAIICLLLGTVGATVANIGDIRAWIQRGAGWTYDFCDTWSLGAILIPTLFSFAGLVLTLHAGWYDTRPTRSYYAVAAAGALASLAWIVVILGRILSRCIA